MSEKDLIQYLYNEINRQNTVYMWIIGVVFATFLIIIGFIQWRISDKQLKKIDDAAEIAKKSNLINLEYSMDFVVSNGGSGFAGWKKMSESYKDFRNLISTYYPDNADLHKKLLWVKKEVLVTSIREIQSTIFSNQEITLLKRTEVMKQVYELAKKYESMKNKEIHLDKDKLAKLVKYMPDQSRQGWLDEIEDISKFWDN